MTLSGKAVENHAISSSQFVMMKSIPKNRTGSYLPCALAEHGVTMLASVLKSPTARKMNIAIVRAFTALRKIAKQYHEFVQSLKELKDRMCGYDAQLSQIHDALENMLDKKTEEENKLEMWENREKIGYKKK